MNLGRKASTLLDEIPLEGGNMTSGVVRVGDTVRRPAAATTHSLQMSRSAP